MRGVPDSEPRLGKWSSGVGNRPLASSGSFSHKGGATFPFSTTVAVVAVDRETARSDRAICHHRRLWQRAQSGDRRETAAWGIAHGILARSASAGTVPHHPPSPTQFSMPLRPEGVRDLELPMTADRIRRALHSVRLD